MIRRTLALVAIVFWTFSAAAPAQGIKSLLESLGAGEKQQAPEPPPAEQLEWARQQLAEFPTESQIAESYQSRIQQAGLPASRLEDFQTAVRDARRSYQGAVEVLSAMAAVQPNPAARLPAPQDEEAASAMRERLRQTSHSRLSAEEEIELLRRMALQQRAVAANAAREVRQFGEEAETSKNEEVVRRARIQADLADLQKRAAEAAVFFTSWKIAQQESLLKSTQQLQQNLQDALRESGFDRLLDVRRADKQLEELQRQSGATEKAIAAALKDQERAAAEVASLKDSSSPAALARRLAAEAQASAAQGLVTSLRGAASLLDIEKTYWVTVRQLADGLDPAKTLAASKQAEENRQVLQEWRPTMDRRLSEARDAFESAQKQLQDGISDPSLRTLVERTASLGQRRLESLGDLISRADHILASQAEFLQEIERELAREGPGRRASRLWQQAGLTIAAVWSFEIFPAGNNSITVGKVVLALIGLAAALVLAGMISRGTGRAATKNFRLAENQRTLVEKSVYVPIAGIFVLTVLYWLNIPLTVFAFLGGALAIGFGFGAQNLMNNFISGIILLLEHQIKVGDIIEVAGSTGKVTHLGSRCSRIRKFDGVELLVPNSAFLEKEVTNWTLADPHHRYDFMIGVSYGSPVDKVIATLESAIERQSEILRDPPSGVFFDSFGDSALVFRVYYWLELGGTLDPRLVGSQLRGRIERDFRAAGIGMPFPQRDIHIRTDDPLPVRFENGPAPENSTMKNTNQEPGA